MTQLPTPKPKRDPLGYRQAPYLRPDDIRLARKSASHLFCVVQDKAPNADAHADGITGPAMGQFGIDIPVQVDGKDAVVTIPEWGDDYGALAIAFGTDGKSWIGKEIAFREVPHEKRDGTMTTRVEAVTTEHAINQNKKEQGPVQNYIGQTKKKAK